mmetsp:Transcript_11175/g.9903  ORF Transcript_11175/g.9903 Transcript_11175/m.9903 type:complete len:129 (+) Transcript_11175:477-863(+)
MTDIMRDSNSGSFTEDILESIRKSNASELMFIPQEAKEEDKNNQEPDIISNIQNESVISDAFCSQNSDMEMQLKRMVVVTTNFTNFSDNYTTLAMAGCEVMKTWRVKNKSDYQWPKDTYLKCEDKSVI